MSTESPREKIRKLARGKNGFGFCCSAMICMKREGTQATRELIRKMREKVPGIALRTTLIVGHPGEGRREFTELMDFVRELGA